MLACRRHGRTVTVGVVLFVLADECKSNIYFRFQPRKICVLKCSLFDSLRQLVANFVRCLALPKCMLKSRNIADGVLNKSGEKTLKNNNNKKKSICLIFLQKIPFVIFSSGLFGCRGLWQASVTTCSQKMAAWCHRGEDCSLYIWV